jgi:hypothetical protein
MSLHYPHHVGKIEPRRHTHSERVAELASRYPKITEDEAEEILAFLRAWRHSRMPFWPNWRESAAVAGGFLVLLVTAWLIWGAFAEAAAALG